MTTAEILHVAVTVGIIQLLCDLLAHYTVFQTEVYRRNCDAYERATFSLRKAQAERDKEIGNAGEGVGDDRVIKENSNGTVVNKKKGSTSHASNTTKKTQQRVDMLTKRVSKAEEEVGTAKARLIGRHTLPSFLTAAVFMILLRVLGTEYRGRVLALLPFTPPLASWSTRLTARGLVFPLLEAGDLEAMMKNNFSDRVTDLSQACAFMFIYVLSTMSIKFYVHQLFGKFPPAGADRGIMSLVDSPMGERIAQAAGLDPQEFKEAMS